MSNLLADMELLDNAGFPGEAAPEEWTPPIPFGEERLPPFPADCLPEIVRDYVNAVAESVQVPVDMAAVASLATVALCVQKKFIIKGKENWLEPLNLYAVIVALPAERKSAVMDAMTKFIYEYEQSANEALQEAVDRNQIERNILLETVKELEKKAAKGKAGSDEAIQKKRELSQLEEVRLLRLLADDCTPEVLASLLSENGGKMAVISSEGGIFEILDGRYTNGVNIDLFLKAHAGDTVRVDRKGRRSEYIPHPALSVLLSIQPVVLDGLMGNNAFRGRGLTARFMYSIPTSKVGTRKFETQPIPRHAEAEFKELLYTLLGIPQSEAAEVIHLSPEAYRVSAAFAGELEPRLCNDLETVADWAGKLHGAILRVAGILHTMQHREESARVQVTGQTMQSAVLIGRYFLDHAQAAYRLMGADQQLQDARHIIRQLEKEHCTEIPRRDLFRKCRGRFKKTDDIVPGLDLLAEYGYIRTVQPEQNGKGRKPDILIQVNPCLYDNNTTFGTISPISPQDIVSNIDFEQGEVTI